MVWLGGKRRPKNPVAAKKTEKIGLEIVKTEKSTIRALSNTKITQFRRRKRYTNDTTYMKK